MTAADPSLINLGAIFWQVFWMKTNPVAVESIDFRRSPGGTGDVRIRNQRATSDIAGCGVDRELYARSP